MLTIDIASFVADAEQSEYAVQYGWLNGTVEVTFQGKTRRVRARKCDDNQIIAFDMAARYPTGSKVWKSSVRFSVDGKVRHINAGVESRSGRIASQPRICGFIEGVRDEYISKR
jgi:hypothetical protein